MNSLNDLLLYVDGFFGQCKVVSVPIAGYRPVFHCVFVIPSVSVFLAGMGPVTQRQRRGGSRG